MFSWSTSEDESIKIKNPIILITTSENMIYIESESLQASGLANGYLKMTNEVKSKYTTKEYFSRYSLDDNNIEFDTVDKFIAGLQKKLLQTIYMFGILLITVTLIIIALLCIILATYDLSYREKVAVKQFLGYSSFSIYKNTIFIISLTFAFELIMTISYRSNIGIVYIILTIILQIILLYNLIKNNIIKKALCVFKS